MLVHKLFLIQCIFTMLQIFQETHVLYNGDTYWVWVAAVSLLVLKMAKNCMVGRPSSLSVCSFTQVSAGMLAKSARYIVCVRACV